MDKEQLSVKDTYQRLIAEFSVMLYPSCLRDTSLRFLCQSDSHSDWTFMKLPLKFMTPTMIYA